jgi:hypothetical protein
MHEVPTHTKGKHKIQQTWAETCFITKGKPCPLTEHISQVTAQRAAEVAQSRDKPAGIPALGLRDSVMSGQ